MKSFGVFFASAAGAPTEWRPCCDCAAVAASFEAGRRDGSRAPSSITEMCRAGDRGSGRGDAVWASEALGSQLDPFSAPLRSILSNSVILHC